MILNVNGILIIHQQRDANNRFVNLMSKYLSKIENFHIEKYNINKEN